MSENEPAVAEEEPAPVTTLRVVKANEPPRDSDGNIIKDPDLVGNVQFQGWADPEGWLPIFADSKYSGELLLTCLKWLSVEMAFDTGSREVFFRRKGREFWRQLDDQHTALLRLEIANQCRLHAPTEKQPFRYVKCHFNIANWVEAILSASALSKRSIMGEYLTGLPPVDDDYFGPTLETWLYDSFGCEDTPLNRFIQKAGLVGLALRTLWPGCLIRAYPVLVGGPDIGKSSMIRSILPPELRMFWTDEVDLSLPDADLIYPIKGKGPIELAEMRGATKGQAQKIKHFTTRTHWKDRLKYGREAVSITFTHMFFGTANSSNSFLPGDQIAAMRFMPIELKHGCDVEDFMSKYREPLLRMATDEALKMIEAVKADDNQDIPRLRIPPEFSTDHKESIEPFRALALDVVDVVDDKLPRLLGERFKTGIQHVNLMSVLKEYDYHQINSWQLRDALEESDLWRRVKIRGIRVWKGTPEAIEAFEPIWEAMKKDGKAWYKTD